MAKKLDLVAKKINFTLEAPTATKVMLAGDFNGWDSARTPLRKCNDRIWRKELKLKTGRYEYKFFVDGNWQLDPKNNNRIVNSFGSENSVIEI